jgi:hypothetical protein
MPSNRWASPLIDDDEGRLDRLRSADRCYQHDIFCESSPHPRPAVSGELARHARGSPVISTLSRESRKTTDKCRSGPKFIRISARGPACRIFIRFSTHDFRVSLAAKQKAHRIKKP